MKKLTVGCVYFTAIMFLLSAFAKCVDIRSFAVLISYIGIIRIPPLVLTLAVLIVTMELTLGLTMILSRALRPLCLKVTLAVLAGFSGILVYAWLFRNLEDCGCFGSFIKMSPLVSLLKNAVLMGIAGVGLYGYSKDAAGMRPISAHRGQQRLKALVLVGSLSLFAGGLTYSASKNPDQSDCVVVKKKTGAAQNSDRKFAAFQIQDQGKNIDLGQGTYLVAFLTDSCPRTQTVIVSRLNALSENNPNFPPVVALVLSESGSLKPFREQFQPNFPLGLLEPLQFFDVIGNTLPPCFYLVRDGKVIAWWDRAFAEDDVIKILEQSKKTSE
ncbi:TPA: hypothetical protein DDW35_09695 [Candidatus Sumerlaeota bacterium]|nr:hypothetical protein [Candidatus Sumerlaeota bacterium]